jgi:hypothetical protein
MAGAVRGNRITAKKYFYGKLAAATIIAARLRGRWKARAEWNVLNAVKGKKNCALPEGHAWGVSPRKERVKRLAAATGIYPKNFSQIELTQRVSTQREFTYENS